jgi:hypothetical protein
MEIAGNAVQPLGRGFKPALRVRAQCWLAGLFAGRFGRFIARDL